MNLRYTQLTEVYLPFISTNQWHYQVISINLHKLKLKLLVQTQISIKSAN